jgi:hypothetical protein
MAAPRQPVNGSTTSVGFTTKLVTVQSVSPDGKTAVAVDRQNTQVSLPMMIQRGKGQLPQPGETWLATQDLGQYTFAAIVAQSPGQFPSSQASGVIVSPTAPVAPSVGEVWIDPAQGNSVSTWNGTSWVPLQFAAQAVQEGTLTAAQLSDQANIAATQVNFTASDIGGITTTISATAPPDPSFGDLWYDAVMGYQLNQWTGTAWVPYQWGTQSIAAEAVTAELIAANTITAEQVAAGIVLAGVIDGTFVDAATFTGSVFQGTDFVINPAGAFFYSGTPVLDGLISSVSTTGGQDDAGNWYLQGNVSYDLDGYTGTGYIACAIQGYTITWYKAATTMGGTSSPWVASATINWADGQGIAIENPAGPILLSATGGDVISEGPMQFQSAPVAVSAYPAVGYNPGGGDLQVADGGDGEKYATQRRTLLQSSASGTITTGYTTIFSSAVSIRSYRVSGVAYINTTANPTTPAIQFTGPTVSGTAPGQFQVTTTRAGALNSSFDVAPNTTGTAFGSITAVQTWICKFDGYVTYTASGTFELQFAATAGSLTIGPYSYIDILPV